MNEDSTSSLFILESNVPKKKLRYVYVTLRAVRKHFRLPFIIHLID